MAYPWSAYKTWVTGEVLTASDLNTSFTTVITNSIPTSIDDYSSSVAVMRTTSDPYPAGSESLATTLAGEFERIRYVINQLNGGAQWYIDPSSSIETVVNGTQTFAGAKTFSSAVSITPTTNQLVLGTTRTVTITAPTPASSSRTWTIPDLSTSPTFMALEGTQTVTGAKTFASSALLLQEAGSTDTVTIAVASLGASRTYTVPDAGEAASFVLTEGTQTINDAKTFGGTVDVTGLLKAKGTTTNDDAAAGYIGEVTESIDSTANNAGTTAQFADIVSISLTAGDWDISGTVIFTLNGATANADFIAAISTNSGNTTTDHVSGDNQVNTNAPTTQTNSHATINYRLKLSGTTTVYLKGRCGYSAGTPQIHGTIRARRAR